MKYKHFFFDMDGTICNSREPIEDYIQKILDDIKSQSGDIIVISGAERGRIIQQIGPETANYIMAQSGSDCIFWKKLLTERDEVEAWRHIRKIQNKFKEYNWGKGVDDKRFVENRGSQITFSLTGFDAKIENKTKFDPTGYRRKIILENIPFISLNLEAKIAGNTSIDYNLKNYNKGKNIERFIKEIGWKKEECVYFGDRFLEGGNDQSVLGVIKCVPVKDPADCGVKLLEFII